MNPNEVIESYVADVIRRVPTKERNDIGFELRSLLGEMLDARAEEAGRPADDAMVLAMLREFGDPAEIAARYRAPGFVIIPAEQTRSFVWLSLGGIALQWAMSLPRVTDSQSLTAWWFTWGLGAFWWPGFMTMMSLLAAWIRQWRTHDPAQWSPRTIDKDRVHRGAMAFGLAWYAIGAAMMIAMPAWISALPEPFSRIFDFAPDFLRTKGWLAIPLWLVGYALYVAVLTKGRWTRATRRMEFGMVIAWVALLSWWISGDMFVRSATNDGARFGLGLVILFLLIDLAVKLWRARPALHAPKIA